jgi:hypothetical protein
MTGRCQIRFAMVGLLTGGLACLLALGPSIGDVAQAVLSDQEVEALAGLERIDDYPLYAMRYVGAQGVAMEWEPGAENTDWGCSLFAALAGEAPVYGRNFDWTFSPALLLFTEPPDGYASVSMVDLAYLFPTDPDVLLRLTELPIAERRPLLNAFTLPFDGMNEKGLAIGMAAVPWSPGLPADPAKTDLDSIQIIREVLDHAANVAEAVSIFERSNVRTTAGPPLHYLVADRSGRAALIEFYEGERVVLWNDRPWHLATNFLCAPLGPSLVGECPRYDRMAERLEETGGALAPSRGIDLLCEVSQPGLTQWSVVYDLAAGEVRVFMGRNCDVVYAFPFRRSSASPDTGAREAPPREPHGT